ncbi:hypothetical protein ACEN85_19880, partial [Curtobacterium sp. CT11-45]|uniref:hypothetical protein n=1 Tax=Curtobacterium sp. CT11-45 TaxID=3243037 RepID=UPI0039AF6DA3
QLLSTKYKQTNSKRTLKKTHLQTQETLHYQQIVTQREKKTSKVIEADDEVATCFFNVIGSIEMLSFLLVGSG